MLKTKIGAVALAVVAPLAVATTSVQAQTTASDNYITVHVSDSTPASGEQFRVRGHLFYNAKPAPDHTVRVQTWRDGAWERITGAHVQTNDEGRYRIRVILIQKGERLMRVVGVGNGDQPNVYKRFTVTVH